MVGIPKRSISGALALGILGVAGYYAIWGGEYTALDLRRLRIQQGVEQERLETTRAEVDSLRGIASMLEKDDVAIERVARERFGMIREGETLYRFIDVEPTGEEAQTP